MKYTEKRWLLVLQMVLIAAAAALANCGDDDDVEARTPITQSVDNDDDSYDDDEDWYDDDMSGDDDYYPGDDDSTYYDDDAADDDTGDDDDAIDDDISTDDDTGDDDVEDDDLSVDDDVTPTDDDSGSDDDDSTPADDDVTTDDDSTPADDDVSGDDDSSCEPDCTGKQCGDDGCGGSCGECAEGEICDAGQCSACSEPQWSVDQSNQAGAGDLWGQCAQGSECTEMICVTPQEGGDGYCSRECTGDEDCDSGYCDTSGAQPVCLPYICTEEIVNPLALECPEEQVSVFISADDSNSQSSPVMLRALLTGSSYPGPFTIRTYEFLNYYNVHYAPLKDEVRVAPQLRAGEEAGSYSLQIGVQSPQITKRRPLNLVFSVDTSGSMGGQGIEMTKAVMRAMARQFQDGDVVSIVQWSDRQGIILENHTVSGTNDQTFLKAVNGMNTGGSTDLESGLETAYDLAKKNYSEAKLNRVVLISDGGANTGVTSIDLIKFHSNDSEKAGIYLVGVGCGDYYNDELMDQVTDAGKGAAVFIDSEAEAERQFNERFLENMDIAALDVRVRLTLPENFDIIKFHGEQISTDPTEVEPQHLGANDAMIFNQVIGSCTPGEIKGSEKIEVDVYYTDPDSRERTHLSVAKSIADLEEEPAPELAKGDLIVTYAEVGKRYQRGGYTGGDDLATCDDLKKKLKDTENTLGDDWAWLEIDDLSKIMCP